MEVSVVVLADPMGAITGETQVAEPPGPLNQNE